MDPLDEKAPKNHWVYYRLGNPYLLNKNQEKAALALKESLKLKPSFKQVKEVLKEID